MIRRWSRKWYVLLLAVLVIGCGARSSGNTAEEQWSSDSAGIAPSEAPIAEFEASRDAEESATGAACRLVSHG